jgi:diacylglycerol kinase (ATP)
MQKTIFIINPCAGGFDHSQDIISQLHAEGIQADTYITRAEKDATAYVNNYCNSHPGETVRFVACGGDGTLNEVATGAIGHSGAQVGCFPCGSGNDYVKYWPQAKFHDLKAIVNAPTVPVDIMQVNGSRYAINAVHVGFEATVCENLYKVRRKPLIGGPMSYSSAIAMSLVGGRRTRCTITIDGQTWHQGDLLLASLANGRFIGGGYKCAPRSQNDDGLLEVSYMLPLSLLRFARSIGYYRKGEHLDAPQLSDVVRYRRADKVIIDTPQPIPLGIDGEVMQGSHFEIQNLHRVLPFAVPTEG